MGQIYTFVSVLAFIFMKSEYMNFFPLANQRLKKRKKGVEGFQPLSVMKYFHWNVLVVAPWGKLVSNLRV